MSEETLRYIVLTGVPGIGKSTLVKKVCHALKEKNFTLNGFFTEEVRSNGERTGFDVVLMNGKRAPLARIKSATCNQPFVGKYAVDVKSFESCVVPVLSSYDESQVLILDEIGKMELFSTQFKKLLSAHVNNGKGVFLVTVPINSTKGMGLVELIKTHPKTNLITIDKGNRNNLPGKIVNLILDATRELATCSAK